MNITEVFATIHINDMDEALPFYERLTGAAHAKRWESPELGLAFSTVGSFVLVAGTDEALASVTDIHSILFVDSLREFEEFFVASGVPILSGPLANPIGTLIIVKHPDGQVVEYLQPHA